MIGANEKGSVPALPIVARLAATNRVHCYHAPSHPHKAVHFTTGGQPLTLRGKRGAFTTALITAGTNGVAHIEVMPWLLDPRSVVRALKDRGILIETRRGQPTRWILRSPVREVQP